MARVENYFFRLFGIMLMFQLMNAHSECIGGIVLHDGTAGLEDDGAVIIMFVYKMNGNAGFGIAGRQNGFVHKAAIHAFAAVIGQQCGMYINNSVGKSAGQGLRHFPEETGKDNKGNARFAENGNVGIAAEKALFFDNKRGNAGFCGDIEHTRAGFIANDEGDADVRVLPEMFDHPGGVAAGAAGKNGYGDAVIHNCAAEAHAPAHFFEVADEKAELTERNADDEHSQRPDKRDDNNIYDDPKPGGIDAESAHNIAPGDAGEAAANGKGAEDQENPQATDLPFLLKSIEHAVNLEKAGW